MAVPTPTRAMGAQGGGYLDMFYDAARMVEQLEAVEKTAGGWGGVGLGWVGMPQGARVGVGWLGA